MAVQGAAAGPGAGGAQRARCLSQALCHRMCATHGWSVRPTERPGLRAAVAPRADGDGRSAPYTRPVGLSAALPALLGTILGALVTLLADRVRWRRELALRSHEARRDAYAGYLAALHTGSEGIRSVALGDTAAAGRLSEAGEAFRTAGVYQAREQVSLLAPEAVTRFAGTALHRLRDLRDLASRGCAVESPDYQRALALYDEAVAGLRTAMRRDFGSAPSS